MEQRTKDVTDLRAKIDRYLDASGLARRGPKIVPLTGDASDRRYFRILLNDGDIGGAGAARRADRLRHAAVRECR